MTLDGEGDGVHLIAVVGLTLAPAAPPPEERERVYNWLGERWRAIAQSGLELPDGGLPLDPPTIDPEDDRWLAFLAGRCSLTASRTARYFRAHDVLGILTKDSVGGDEIAYQGLCTDDQRGDQPVVALGEARLLVCTAPCPRDVELGACLKSLNLDGGSGRQFGAVTSSGALIVEIEGLVSRTFAVVVPESQRQLADELTWMVPGRELGSLVRYVLHAAKLRYQIGVFQAVLPELRAREKRLDATLDELFRLHAWLEGERGRLDRSLLNAHNRLAGAHEESAALVVMASRLRELARSSETALHNLGAHSPPVEKAIGPEGSSSFERDRALAKWLSAQVEQELGYIASTRERVTEAQQLAALRLEEARQEQARLANWLSVLQTSVLAAVLGCLGVIEAVGSTFDFEGRPDVQWAVLITVPLLALLLPPLALRWVTGVGRIDPFAGALCGAVVAWTVAVLAKADPALVGAAIGVGAVLGAKVLYGRRRRQST